MRSGQGHDRRIVGVDRHAARPLVSLEDAPETVNSSPYDEGWLVEIEISDKSETDKLLDADSYKNLI